ncbi:mediator of RNA polymerase II transcription subunit 13 [Bactrocera neohumeralis]|uniref:mediator of RNA polymerase II transcription subunit 13 n=1 Tax=Bactrocera neohumeralis TaxID=98809 RepID=UPI0021662E48|nr:mediator of RNA polymerase II transcription subunit 13 [Bactrocera neohumeralis]XP_050333364.1 mediator of RNA polymerase II transcription subunit 13 [Bactrocera neohumeralis]XP_050333365.1 mediator of RNA polymerase II transcription subunit 13 [Bactrocera neohumeralis]
MTHQNHQTNGASLEDCHTNFFALTDLCGIKWRKFVNSERVNASSDPLDDPILRSYSRCMQADILCVWRRIPSTKQDNSDLNPIFEISTSKVHPPLSLAAAKELWIFWYGEEPDLSELVDAELLKVAANQALWNGTWERGLTYECRSLLFKALHNLMERFVLTKDIVRFGKWFVQPCTSNDRLFGRSSQHLSFSFTFFVHGDTVCASIDLREHPAVRPLSKEHLTEAAAAFAAAGNSQTLSQSHEHGNVTNLPEDVASPHSPNSGGAVGDGGTNSNSPNSSTTPKPRRVILAPFGMAATLTGNSFKATDPMAEKILEDWASFFPLCNKENSDVPPVVEVVSGGHKMYHPSIYVLVTDLDDMEEMEAAASQKGSLGTTSSAEAAALAAISSANTNEFTGNSRKSTSTQQPASLQQQQLQQQMHTVTTVTTVATSCSQANSSGVGGSNGINSNSSIAMVEQHLHELSARAQPYYDTTASSFTSNTTNTHASPQAATEMPERVWQDCITNTLHVTYAASVAATAMSTGATTAQITCSSLSTTTGGVTTTTATGSGTVGGEDCNSTSGNNGNNDNNAGSVGGAGNSSGGCSSMDTQNTNTKIGDANEVEAKLRMQQMQFWGFVDPTEKTPCSCTKTLNPASMTPHDTPHGGASTYSRNSVGDLMPVPSVGSPGTPAQSPHPNSTLSQPTSVPPADQLLTMSPRAPPSVPNLQQPPTPIDHLLDKNTPAPTPTDQHDNKSITTSPYVRPTPSVEPPPSVEAGNGGGGVTGVGPNGPGSVPQPPSVGRSTPTISGQQQQQQQQQGSQQSQAQIMGTGTTGSAGPQCGTISIKKFEIQQPSLTTLSADQIKPEPGYAPTPLSGSGSRNGLPEVSTSSAISAADAINDYWKSFKMPEIKVKDIDSFANDDCSKYNVLYDFTYQNAWANHPMKRFKLNDVTKPCRSMCTKNLYEGHTHSKPLMPSPGSIYGSQLLSIDASLNSLTSSAMNAASASGSSSGGLVGIAAHCGNLTNIKEENVGSDGNGNGGGYFRGLDIQTTDALQGTASPCKDGKSSASGDLYTAEGLNPTMNDLEQLFETSNDGCGSVQIHTPPDSNNPSNGSTATTTIDDLKRSTAVAAAVNASAVAIAALQNCTNTPNASNSIGNNGSSNGGGNGGSSMAEDLTKMFPTPPSHEQHHPNSSPCQMDIQMTDLSVITAATAISGGLEAGMGGMIKIKQEYFAELGSPVEEPIEDWSYVYRPPKRAKFVGSSKYAPLTNLPSQTLPPLALPTNCTYKPSWTTQKSRAVVAAQAAAAQQQQQQQLQQLQQQHQQLHELLSAAPRTPLQQPRTPLGPIPSPMHSNTVPTPLSSGGGGVGGGNNLLLNQLNCPQAALTNTPGSTSMQQMMQRAGMSPISPSPASVVPFPMMQPQRHPPPPYEMAVASPATSTSSYLNKQYHSQEHPPTPQSVGMPSTHLPRPLSAAGNLPSTGVATGAVVARELPEVSSLIVNILLYDTALNVFRDHNFDSSTVCVCNADSQKVGNIRGADSGVYVPLPGGSFNPLPPSSNASGNPAVAGISGSSGSGGGGAAAGSMRLLSAFGGGSALDSPASLPGTSGHTGSGSSSSSNTPASNQHITGYVDDDPVDCTCGFSAVVNRRLAFRAGLFYEDEMEITGVAEDPARNKKQSLPSLIANLAAALTPTAVKLTSSLAIKGANSLLPAQADKANHVQPDAQALQHAHVIFDLLLEQCSIIQTSSSAVHRALQRHRHRLARQSRQPQSVAAISNVLEFVDANDVICLALEQARLAFESNRMDVNEFSSQNQLSPFDPSRPGTAKRNHQLFGGRLTVHKWPYIPVGFSRSNKEIVRTMNFIQPMLQNAFHSKSRSAAGSKDATYTVSGPLTWRQFHRLAGRASGQCEPQPIPSVIVGHDKDWVSVAPLAIHYWDKLLLEPYAYARDIVYLVVCPETDFVVQNTRTYFRELSSTYEMCKLGRHTPIRGWDGLLTVGPRSPTDNTPNSTPLDDWLRTLDNTAIAEKIRLYASAFHNQIAPYLNRVPGDKTLLNPPENSSCQPGAGRERGTTSPMGSMSSIHSSVSGVDQDKTHTSPKIEGMDQQQQQQQLQHQQMQHQQQQQQNSAESIDMKPDIKPDTKPPIVLSDPLGMGETMEDINPPAIVLYVVEPFTFGSDSPELERLACIALLRCYAELLKSIPDSVRANINIQIISLESIVELGRSRTRKRFSDEIRCLALNIFSQCRRHMVHTQAVKSLTGFGTAANMEAFLKSKDDKNRQPYKMYTPPYVLAPMHEKNDKTDFSRQSSSMRALNEQKYSVMYCNYCLSEDQCWLLATVTDDRGEMFEKIIINIDVPNRARRRKAPARRVGLKKLMDFIMGLISQTAHHWRLVVGRIGRIGHSELKSWSSLLSKQNLQKASKQLKDICKQCSFMYPPGILSACLVTLEPDSKLRVMPDQFTPDERFSQISMQNPLSTPQDVTCTHILVFPTSAVCLSFTRQFQNEPQVDLENDIIFDDDDENGGFTDAELMGDLLDWDPQPGRLSNHCSPDRMEDNRSWPSAGGNNFNSAQQQDVEEVGSINQQPLAVGYMVSTAPTGRMPSWFWAACPHLEDVCPVFLKTALHLHVPNIQTADDILNSTNAHSSAIDHPLDSSLTADVLRFVLEGYNALSWLALDSNTHDRLSCLPINVQMLMDLYYLTAAIM